MVENYTKLKNLKNIYINLFLILHNTISCVIILVRTANIDLRKDVIDLVIQGFQKLTLLDYPGKMACTVFTSGCNLRCPFCHNSRLVINPSSESEYSVQEILDYLKKRQGILDGVAITGGEPLLHNDIDYFIEQVRALGFSVKLDTNGTFPEKLKDLVGRGLIDYVAMDIKNSPEGYPETYTPDDRPVSYTVNTDSVVFNARPDEEVGILKTVTIKMDPDDANMVVNATVKNISGKEKEFAVWVIAVCSAGGDLVIPMNTNDTGLLHNRAILCMPFPIL
jgi:anaerobic ribonucleoside-triphosphate reductase activating protein